MPIAAALLPILGAVAAAGGTKLLSDTFGSDDPYAKKNARTIATAKKMAEPETRQVIGTNPEEYVANLDQLFQSVVSPMLGVLGQAMVTPPPELPTVELTPAKQISYNVAPGGKLSAQVSPAPVDMDAQKRKDDAQFMQKYMANLQMAPPGVDTSNWALDRTMKEGYTLSNYSWLKYGEPDPDTLRTQARLEFIRRIGEGESYWDARNAIDAKMANLPIDSWPTILQETFNTLTAGNFIALRYNGYGQEVPEEYRKEHTLQEAQRLASQFLQGYAPPKDAGEMPIGPDPYTGRAPLKDYPAEAQVAATETLGVGLNEPVGGAEVGGALEAQRAKENEENLIREAEAAQAKKVLAVRESMFDLEGLTGEIAQLSAEVNTSGGWWRLLNGASTRWAALKQEDEYGEIAADFIRARKSFLARFARSFGEVGTLTEGDIARAEGMLPTIWDSEGLAKRKIERLNRYVARKYREIEEQSWRMSPRPVLATREQLDAAVEKYGSTYSPAALKDAMEELKAQGIDTSTIPNVRGLPEDPMDLFLTPNEEE